MEATFKVGDQVQRINAPEDVGKVVERRWNRQLEVWMYTVQFWNRRTTLPESSLQEFSSHASPWDSLRKGLASGTDHLVSLLTYHRLRRPPSRLAYSFSSSRTEFYPHQFKPLLRFLDHPGKRLLVADDVGLGKTIEAGYILLELEARQAVDRVLVVVPARLATKWKNEMRSRFDRTFEKVDGRELIGWAERVRRGQDSDRFRWIVSYESARLDAVRKALEEVQPALDVLVVDEAHRLRNTNTLQHRAGDVLCGIADTALFLSATPVQNGIDDLWSLLRLLSPAEFEALPVFERQIAANQPLNEAQAWLSHDPPDLPAALAAFRSFGVQWPAASEVMEAAYLALEQRLSAPTMERRELVEAQFDLAALSPTAHIISRTRKVEAIPNRPVREAFWHQVSLSPVEQRFCSAVKGLCRRLWASRGENWGFQMALLNAYRITASCIPAAVRYFESKLGEWPVDGVDAIEEDADGADAPGPEPWHGEELREAVLTFRHLAGVDTKLRRLRDALAQIWADDDAKGPRRKVVVFSYFVGTIDYLSGALYQEGIRNRAIHGKMPIREREEAIEDFLNSESILVLITSEVGGEGIDLQRASIVVNYDLPWNPMRVEQRIGRVDRIGQAANRILVLNFLVDMEVDKRILKVLLDKLGVFRESIGEIDDIVGNRLQELTMEALSGALTGEALDRRVAQEADALERRLQQAREVLSRVDGLLAADQALVDEINAITGEHQIPNAVELRLFLNAILARHHEGCQFPEEITRRVVSIDLRGGLAQAIEAAAAVDDTESRGFARRASMGPLDLTLSREAGYHHPSAELIHLKHPLVTYCVGVKGRERETNQSFALRLSSSRHLEPGLYLFHITLVEIGGIRPSTRLCSGLVGIVNGRIWTDPAETAAIIAEVSEHAEPITLAAVDDDAFSLAREQLDDALAALSGSWKERERRLGRSRGELRHAALVAIREVKVRREMDRVAKLEASGAPPKSLELGRAKIRKAEGALSALLKAPPADVPVEFEQIDVAVGYLEVV